MLVPARRLLLLVAIARFGSIQALACTDGAFGLVRTLGLLGRLEEGILLGRELLGLFALVDALLLLGLAAALANLDAQILELESAAEARSLGTLGLAIRVVGSVAAKLLLGRILLALGLFIEAAILLCLARTETASGSDIGRLAGLVVLVIVRTVSLSGTRGLSRGTALDVTFRHGGGFFLHADQVSQISTPSPFFQIGKNSSRVRLPRCSNVKKEVQGAKCQNGVTRTRQCWLFHLCLSWCWGLQFTLSLLNHPWNVAANQRPEHHVVSLMSSYLVQIGAEIARHLNPSGTSYNN